MKRFIVLFREPDGRVDQHSPEEIQQHQQNWKTWFEKWGPTGHFEGGSALSLEGNILKGNPPTITPGIHYVGQEIVGGYILLNAADLAEANTILQSCPIFEFDGYAEVRELKKD